MKDPLGDHTLFYARPRHGALRRLGIVLSALVLTAGTVLLIPLSDALRQTSPEKLELRTATTTAWRPPPPPPPQRLAKPPPPAKPRTPAVAKEKPAPPKQAPEPHRQQARLPLRLDFQVPRFEADFALDFAVDPTATEIPEAIEAPAPPPAPPAPPPPAKDTYESHELDQNPVPVSRQKPLYPSHARRKGIEGHADLRFTVNARGLVEDATVFASSPPGLFDSVALRAIRSWRFQPGIRDGKPVAARLEIRILFRLDQ